MTRCQCFEPGEGYGTCPGPESCPLCQPEDDFDPVAAAEAIPLAWLECLGDASDTVADTPRVLGFVPTPGGACADLLSERILDCKDANWLLVLALNHPQWAEQAMRRAADLCKATPTWHSWLQVCQDEHDESRQAEAESFELERGEAIDAAREFHREAA